MNYNMSFCTKSIKSLDVWVFLLKLIKSAVLPDKVNNPLSGCWTDCLIINHDDLVPWDQFAFWWTPCQNKPKKDLMVQTLHGPTFFFFPVLGLKALMNAFSLRTVQINESST